MYKFAMKTMSIWLVEGEGKGENYFNQTFNIFSHAQLKSLTFFNRMIPLDF